MNLLKGETSSRLTPRKWPVILCASGIPSGVGSDASVSPDAHDDDRCEDAEQHTRGDMFASFMHAEP